MLNDTDTYLVFEAKMLSDYPEDACRVFMIQYFLSNKTIQIVEKKDDKKGIRGGRFLSRMTVKDPRTGENYDDDAFFVGNKIQAAGRIFDLVDAPEYTLCEMEAHSDRFKQSDLQVAVQELSDYCKSTQIDLNAKFAEKDTRQSGQVSEADAKYLLFSFTPTISKQACITVLRRFVENGRFNYSQLIQYL